MWRSDFTASAGVCEPATRNLAVDVDALPRDRIVQALAVTVARDGFADSKVQDIARAGHVSLRTLYELFANKEACLLELHGRLTRTMLERVPATAPAAPWRTAMGDVAEACLAPLAAHPRLAHAVVVELARLSPAAQRAREDAIARFVERLCAWIELGRAANPAVPSRPLSPQTGRFIVGGATELLLAQGAAGASGQLAELAETVADALHRAVVREA